MTQRAWASRTRRRSEASSGNTLNQYLICSSSFSCGSTGVGCASSATASDTGRSASSQPSGPVWTREWLVLCKEEPVAQWTRRATACTCIVPLVPSRHLMVCQAEVDKDVINSLTVYKGAGRGLRG